MFILMFLDIGNSNHIYLSIYLCSNVTTIKLELPLVTQLKAVLRANARLSLRTSLSTLQLLAKDSTSFSSRTDQNETFPREIL